MNIARAQFRLAALALFAFTAALVLAVSGTGTASAGVFTELEFAPGTSSAGVGGAIVRGESDTYLVEARAGQLLSASVGSVGDNATLTLIAPDGLILAVEELYTEVVLPQSGFYVLNVAPSWGNSEYWLEVAIV